MTHPGPEHAAPAESGPTADAQQSPVEKKTGAKKWASLAGTVAIVGAGAAYQLTGGFGIGDPKVNDCVQMKGDTDFDVVDCGSADAQYKIVGIDDQKMKYPDFQDAAAADTICTAFQTWEVALWIGDVLTEPGTIYCSEPV